MNKADGTKKRAYGIKKPDGSQKIVVKNGRPSGAKKAHKSAKKTFRRGKRAGGKGLRR